MITPRIYAASLTPNDPVFPFGRLDAFRSEPLDGPCHAGAVVSFYAHGFAKDRKVAGKVVETGEDIAANLGSGMKRALHNRRVDVPGGSARLRVRSVRLLQDPADRSAYHSILECEARVLAA